MADKTIRIPEKRSPAPGSWTTPARLAHVLPMDEAGPAIGLFPLLKYTDDESKVIFVKQPVSADELGRCPARAWKICPDQRHRQRTGSSGKTRQKVKERTGNTPRQPSNDLLPPDSKPFIPRTVLRLVSLSDSLPFALCLPTPLFSPKSPLFQLLDDEETSSSLASHLDAVKFPNGPRRPSTTASRGDAMYIVRSGKAELVRSRNDTGEKIVLENVRTRATFFGELSFPRQRHPQRPPHW